MIQTKCLGCGCDLLVNHAHGGDGYFFGYDTEYYGDTIEEESDPHEIVGHYCKECGDKLRNQAEAIGWERLN